MQPFIIPPHRAKIALAYYAFIIVAALTVNYFVLPGNLMTAKNFENWDARNYLAIRNEGYSKDKAKIMQRVQAKFRIAFFPLFPLIWRLIPVNTVLISIFNGLLFVLSFLLLARALNFQGAGFLACLSVPNAIFFFLPYTESTFFFTSTLLLVGLHKGNKPLTCAGILLSSLSRPAFTVFVPAIILMEIFTNKNRRDAARNVGIYLLMFLIAFIIVGLIQYHDTGQWFKFLSAQKHWGAGLRLPDFPFSTYQGGIILLLDGAALLTGVIASALLLVAFFKNKIQHIPRHLLFSLLYVAGISFAVVIMRGGTLFSLNRFVFVTPFFFVLLNAFISGYFKLNYSKIISIVVFLLLFSLLFGTYQGGFLFLIFLGLISYLTLYALLKTENEYVPLISFWVIVCINAVLQNYFYFRFLSGGWVA